MHRLTTNKNVSEMSMYELAHNACYSKDGVARYRDFEMDMDARGFARKLMITLAGDDLSADDDVFDEEIMENLMYDPFESVTGLVALFYRNLWAMADLRETLKAYEDSAERDNGWIPVEEKQPELFDNVLVCTKDGGRTVAYRCHDQATGRYYDLHSAVIGNVVAWQPLPKLSQQNIDRQKKTNFDRCCESIEAMAQIIEIAKIGWTKDQIIEWLKLEAEE